MDYLGNASDTWNDTNATDVGDFSMPEGPSPWGFWVKFVTTPVIVLIGMVGNCLSLVVMKSKTLRHKSYSHYLCALAVFDTITLIIRLVKTVDEYYSVKLDTFGLFQKFNDGSCKVFDFLEHVSYLMSSWLVVLMAIERLIAVRFPFKRVVIRHQTGATIVIGALLLLICASQSFRLTMIEHIIVDHTRGIRICAASNEHHRIYSYLTVYFYQWTLTFVLPVSLILVCNSMVLYQVFKVRREIKQKEKCSRYNRVVKNKYRTTCMLLIVSFTYIGTLLPLFTLTLIIDVSVKLHGPAAYPVYKAVMPYLEVCIAISLLNYAANFFIYVLSGKSFRFELAKIFHKDKYPRRSFTARSTREEMIRL